MKLTFMSLAVALLVGLTGCSTLGKPLTVPEENPELKIDKADPKPVKLPPAKTSIDPDEINDANYTKQAKELENEMNREKRFVSPAK